MALGVGGLIVALPAVADADTGTGNSGKTSSSAGKHAPRHSANPAPRKSPPTAAAKPYGAVAAASRRPLDRLGAGGDPLAPVTEPLSFAVLAATRRDGIARSARSVASGGTASAAAASVPSASGTGDVPLAASATADSALGTAVRDFIDSHLPGWSPIADQLAPIVANGIQDLLSNGKVSAEVNQLVTNDVILQFVSTKIATALNSYLGVPQAVGTVIGNAAASVVRNTLGNIGVQNALDTIATAVQPTGDQYVAITTGLASGDVQPLSDYLKTILANSSSEITGFLSDPAVQAALSSATAGAVIDLTSGPTVPVWLGNVVAGWVTDGLGGGAAAQGLGTALGDAVQNLLTDDKAMQGLAAVAGVAVTNILNTPNVPAALADYLTQFATAYLAGTNWVDALDIAWQGLQANSAFLWALGPAAGTAVYSLATNADVVSALSATVTGLVNDVAGDAAVRTFLGELFGPTYGPTVVNTLADPASAAQLAATAGSVLVSFLGQPGVAGGLSAAANQIVTTLLAGMPLTDALQGALQSLMADPAVVAAFNATVPAALQGALKAPAVQQVISVVAQGVVANLFDKTALDTVATSQVTKSAVDALLSNPAAQDLIGTLAGEILTGTPTTDLVSTVVHEVVKSPTLQIALGQAVGQGIGALFGDTPIGFAVGQVAGVAAALFFGLASGAAQLFGQAGGAAAGIPGGRPYLLITVSAA